MTEATWGNSAGPTAIEWTMSAALENVLRGDTDLAEVTSLEGAVRAWRDLDPEHRTMLGSAPNGLSCSTAYRLRSSRAMPSRN